ncbi:multicopper oxidase domain-containing protein [Actinoplanes sp. NPDC023714]|uniref:multicopper oxidase domain-containing protein n=1 Tax=Actinoplanes sp. NPDC023714 TaxID=3154322 RepID=UPI0033F74B04
MSGESSGRGWQRHRLGAARRPTCVASDQVDQLGPIGTAAAAGVQDAGVARAATGNPWWVDSLDVADGDSYEIAFVANNPGIRADHCHRLAHVDVSTPYRVGGEAGNSSE